MAKPLPNEEALVAAIIKSRHTIAPEVWELIRHHLGNDLHVIQLILELHIDSQGQLLVPSADAAKLVARCEDVRCFLNRLRDLVAREADPPLNHA